MPIDPNTGQEQQAQSLLDLMRSSGSDINPQTGGAYDPLGLLGGALQYHQMFDPSGAEDRIRTANTVATNTEAGIPSSFAPWITQAAQGPAMGSEPGFGESGQALSAGAPPSYVETGNESVFPSIFNARAPRSGLFNLSDYYRGAPERNLQDNPAGRNVPTRFSAGSSGLSTNDWRLLPPQYRNPNYFMINGRIIDRDLAASTINPSAYSVLGMEGGESAGGRSPINRGASPQGETGYPRISWSGWNARTGYPGQLGGWSTYARENY